MRPRPRWTPSLSTPSRRARVWSAPSWGRCWYNGPPQDALNKAMAGRTVIEIAHRVSTVRRAQNVAVMQVLPRRAARAPPP